jgi:hypothetical protein
MKYSISINILYLISACSEKKLSSSVTFNICQMSLSVLNAISPIDGRYRSKVTELESFFSEQALIKYRILIEIEYFIALC